MLIEVRVQLNGTLRQDIDRVASAIRVAKVTSPVFLYQVKC